MIGKPSSAEQLCLSCGLCCNGVIFADVQLQSRDHTAKLKAAGLAFSSKKGKPCLHQPCSALQNGACRVYANRPSYCREFDCALLKSVLAGKTEMDSARRVVRKAHKRVEHVRMLLKQLGDTNESLALSKRFQRVRRRLETSVCSPEDAHLFAELTMALHSLNILIADTFYPGRVD